MTDRDQYKAQYERFVASLDTELNKFPLITQLEAQTKIPKTHISIFFAFLLFICVVFNFAGPLVTNIIGFLYPAFASFKAIESSSKTDDTQWLTYWCVFGFINVMEYFSDLLLYWIPFYYLFKTVALLWLFLPSFRGAELLYVRFVRPTLVATDREFDQMSGKVKAKANAAAKDD